MFSLAGSDPKLLLCQLLVAYTKYSHSTVYPLQPAGKKDLQVTLKSPCFRSKSSSLSYSITFILCCNLNIDSGREEVIKTVFFYLTNKVLKCTIFLWVLHSRLFNWHVGSKMKGSGKCNNCNSSLITALFSGCPDRSPFDHTNPQTHFRKAVIFSLLLPSRRCSFPPLAVVSTAEHKIQCAPPPQHPTASIRPPFLHTLPTTSAYKLGHKCWRRAGVKGL